MAGHSKFKNIMYRKGGQDAKRAQAFTKLAREITVAAKMGLPDPDSNARLRSAIAAARAQSMPKDNIQRAIDKAVSGGDADNLVELRYEGYGPGNVAVIVECLTDNKNRTAAEVRTAFNKNGGAMGETGSVAFNFDRVGLIHYAPGVGDSEKVLDAAIEAGADDVESSEDGHDIYCQPDDLASLVKALEGTLGESETSRLDWRPKMSVAVDADTMPLLMKFLSALDDSDDVQRVAANYEIDDAVMASLEG